MVNGQSSMVKKPNGQWSIVHGQKPNGQWSIVHGQKPIGQWSIVHGQKTQWSIVHGQKPNGQSSMVKKLLSMVDRQIVNHHYFFKCITNRMPHFKTLDFDL
jgi:hypothetical protein